MPNQEDALPPELAEVNRQVFDYADGEGVDFEPHSEFTPAEETEAWFRAWTGNPNASGSPFRIFGQDGSGGYAAIWKARPNAALLDQPIVFLGSEGEMAVIAADFTDFLHLLASGVGPFEATAYPDILMPRNDVFARMARSRAGGDLKSRERVLGRAAAEFPDFRAWVESQCR